MIYATLATLGVLLSSIPVAYALAKLRWRGRDAVFLVVLVALMLPPQVSVGPALRHVGEARERDRHPVHRHALAADHPGLAR